MDGSVSSEDSEAVNRWIMLVAVMVGTFLSILDTTIMNVALPHIMVAFGTDVESARWVTTGFLSAAACSMPLTGWLGRRVGYGKLYLAALGTFTLGAAASASALDINSLIAARVLQGLGAGMIQPASISLLTRAFPPEYRGRAFGIWSIGVMTAPTLGPTLGGFLIHWINWRAIFTMSLLVGLFAILVAMLTIPREHEEDPVPFDGLGYLLLATFLISALLAVANGERMGWDSGPILAGGALSASTLLLFILQELGNAHPIVPLRLFRIPDFSLAMLISLYRSLGLFGTVFLLPIFLQQVQGRDSLSIGLIMMPGALSMVLCSPLVGWFTDRFGGRWPTVFGVIFLAYSLYLYHSLDALSALPIILLPQVFRGVGIALIMTPVITTGMNAVSYADTGYASWMLNLSQRMGAAFSISILSTLLQRGVAVQKLFIGEGFSIGRLDDQALVHRGMSLGLSEMEAKSAALGAVGKQIHVAATSLAFQNLFLLTALVTLTAVVPAYFLRRYGQKETPAPQAANA